MAAAIGNQYAAKSKRWTAAIDRAIAKRSKVEGVEALDTLAEKLLEQVDAGDVSAIKELGDRLEGKPAQSVTLSGDPDNPLQLVERRVVKAK